MICIIIDQFQHAQIERNHCIRERETFASLPGDKEVKQSYFYGQRRAEWSDTTVSAEGREVGIDQPYRRGPDPQERLT